MTSNAIVYGVHDENTLKQFETCMNTGSAAKGVLCADGHYGYNHPIGGVVGYTDHISISGVGFDIACGNMAICLDTDYADIKADMPKILHEITRSVSFGIGRKNNERVDHELFEDDIWQAAEVSNLKEMARDQLGTVGSGNHYVDIFEDDNGKTWIGVHFGSRGLGHKITTKYLDLIGAKDTMEDPPALMDIDSDVCKAYLAGLELGGMYAYAGREWVVEKVRQIIGGHQTFMVHNHHNFCWKEQHDGKTMYVVRKGATPAFPGQYGFVGGSMGDNAVILRGVESPQSNASMYSTVHGAGRVMSRTDARGKRNKKTGVYTKEPRVDKTEWQEWLKRVDVQVIGSDLDEAPQAYRRLPEVLAYHASTIEIMHTLMPRGVIMAGSKEFDPYKD